MKKIRIIYFLCLIVFLRANEYRVNYQLSQPVFKQEHGHMFIEMDQCMQIGSESEPLMPKFPINYLLPPGETLDMVELIIDKSKTYPLMLPMLPKQADRPLSWGRSEQGFVKNQAIYELEEYKSQGVHANVQYLGGAGILIGNVDVARYFPKSGTVEIAESVELIISTRPSQKDAILSKTQFDILGKIVQNPDMLSAYSMIDPNEKERMLIITTVNYVTVFDTLVDHYLKYGIEAQVLSTSDIFSNYSGLDLPEKIRNAIREKYMNEGVDYVLLGGNSLLVPHRGLSCQVFSGGTWISSNDIPSDLYYAGLDGTWDDNSNGIYGEYSDTTDLEEADLLPELAVGRMPASDEVGLKNMIVKSIRYQEEPIVEEMNKHVFFGEFLWNDPISWAADYLELLIGLRNDNGYTTQGLISGLNIKKWYDQDSLDYWDETTVKQELAQGYSFLHHDGHANTSYMMKFSLSEVQDSDFVSVNGIDHTTPVFYSHGCNCGGFDYSTCIASKIVTSPYISVGGAFNSRYGWFNEGQTEGPSIHLHREFENAIYGLHYNQFGWALTLSRISTTPWVTALGQWEQNALRWNFYTINILGDPAMSIFSDTPKQAEISYDLSSLHEAQIAAYVSVDGSPKAHAGLAVIDSTGQLIAFSRSNALGNISIQLPYTPVDGDKLTCYLSGENILLQDTTITSLESGLELPRDFVLLETYPNPFNPEVTIAYNLPQAGEIAIQIFDIQGKLVQRLYQEFQTAGEHKLTFNAEDLSAGIYLCRLQANDQVKTNKLILLK